MTDAELIRAAEVCEGQPLRLMAARLKAHRQALDTIADCVASVPDLERQALAGTAIVQAIETIETLI